MALKFRRDAAALATRRLVHNQPQRQRPDLTPGTTMHGIVLGSTVEDTTIVDIASGALLRWRIPWDDAETPLRLFDVVEGVIAGDPERDDLAQPEALTLEEIPRQLGSYRGRRLRKWLDTLRTPADGPLFGFRGPSSPYWEFTGERPSVAVIVADRGPQLLRRREDESTWVRFGWERDDVWLLCEDPHAVRAMEASRRESLTGKDLATVLGYKPHFVLATLSRPMDGHCYKICTGLLPRG